MMTVRFLKTRRERIPEWIMAAAVFCWGSNAFVDCFLHVQRHMMDSPFFIPLLSMMPQKAWGVFATMVGFTRLTFLTINGSLPRGSVILRAAGAGLSAFFWTWLVIGAFELPWVSGAIYSYGALLAFDTVSLWYAASEISSVFERARGRA